MGGTNQGNMLPPTSSLAFAPHLVVADGWNSWTSVDGSCETTYEWEVVRSPGLTLVASSSQTISPCSPTSPAGVLCTGTDDATRGCSNIVTDLPGSGLSGECRPTQATGRLGVQGMAWI